MLGIVHVTPEVIVVTHLPDLTNQVAMVKTSCYSTKSGSVPSMTIAMVSNRETKDLYTKLWSENVASMENLDMQHQTGISMIQTRRTIVPLHRSRR